MAAFGTWHLCDMLLAGSETCESGEEAADGHCVSGLCLTLMTVGGFSDYAVTLVLTDLTS